MSHNPLTIEQVLTLLRATPLRLAQLSADLSTTQLRTTSASSEWSANDVLAHLRSCADVWGDCIKKILDEDMPTIRAIHPSAWIKQTNYPNLEFQPSLGSFAHQRTELLAMLEPLPIDAWERSATVTGAGKVLERTVLFYAQWLARHERTHIKQVERLIKTMQR